jgi:hypothetical protein
MIEDLTLTRKEMHGVRVVLRREQRDGPNKFWNE